MRKGKLSFFNVPENAFVVVGVIFGILFLLITPPFQAPDEYNHFYRAFQISEGRIVAERQQGHIGGLLPRTLATTAERVSKDLKFQPENKQKLEDIFALLDLPLTIQDRVFLGFPNTAVYTPIPYLPQAVGIGVGRIVSFSPVILTYIGRIFNLLF